MNFIHASMHLCILTALHLLPKDWILSVKHSNSVYWHIKIKLRVLLSYMDILPLVFLCLHQGPLRWNGHWFSLFTSRPSPMEWSLIFFLYIKALSNGMVIDFLMFTSRPSPMERSFISFFTSMPSPMEWSLISLSQHDPLLQNGRVCFLLLITTLFFELVFVHACFVFSFFPLKPKRN